MKIPGSWPGELSAKTAAKSYWKKELKDELDDLQLHEEWTFGKANEGHQHTGSEDDAMEFVGANVHNNYPPITVPRNARIKVCFSYYK